MAPKRWTTEAELKFLQSQYRTYLEYKAKKDLSHFWNPVSFDFFKQFSEKEKLFGSDTAMLTPEQATELKNAIAARGEQIVHWFRNEGNKGNRRTRDAGKVKGLHLMSLSKPAGRRRLQPVELYSRKYYDEKIKPLVAAEIERDGLGKQQTLAVVKRVTREVFENESKDVKDEIQADIDAQHAAEDADAEEADSQPSPLQRQLALDNAPTILREFLRELSRKTGWCFTVFGGGPTPQERGDLRTISIHEGKTESGLTFADSIDIKARCIKPFAEFIAAVYPKEVRVSYAIDAPQHTASTSPQPSEGLSNECEAELASSTGLSEGPSPGCDTRHPSLPSSLHLNSESLLSDSLDFHSDGNQMTEGLMLDTSGAPPTSPAGSNSSMPTTDLGQERAAAEELQALLPDDEGSSSAILDPFPYGFAQLEQTDLTSIVLSPRSISLLDDLFPDSAHPLDLGQNVTQNHAVGSNVLLPANASFESEIESSASSALLLSQSLMLAPPASFVSSPSTAFTSQLLQATPPVSSEIEQPLHALLPVASEPEQPLDVSSPVTSNTQPFPPVSTPTTSTGAHTRPARNRRAPPRPDATPPPLSRCLPSSGAKRSVIGNIEGDDTVEAEKGHGKGGAKGKENAVDAEVKKPSRKRSAASQGGRKAKKVRI